MNARRGGWAARVALALAALALVLALGEVVARLIERDHRGAAPGARGAGSNAAADANAQPSLTRLVDLARPDVDGMHKGVPFRTNAEGVRGPAIAPAAAPGTTRILFVGDSVTMGAGVREEDAYPARVADLLARPVETINGGLSGLNATAVMDRLDRLDDAYAPDVLVYGFTINDVEGPAFEPGDDAGAIVRLWQRAARHRDSPSALVRQLWPRWVMLQERLSSTFSAENDGYVRNALENPAAWATVTEALDRLATRAGGRCAVVVIHTHLKDLDAAEHPYLPVYAKVEAAARARGLAVIPTFETFAGRRAARLWVSFLDPHPSREGHALLARAVAEGLEALPDACWRTR